MDSEPYADNNGSNNGSMKRNDNTVAPARGILKSSQTLEFVPSSQMGGSSSMIPSNVLPTRIPSRSEVLDGNNTTSRLDLLTLQDKGNRRVSFAPDVTLHSFDFVPEQRTHFREPRRRANEILVTSTQNEDVDDNATGSQPMDLTSPVSALPQPYKPVIDQEVSMDITELFSKQEELHPVTREETMDLTAIQKSEPSQGAVASQETVGNEGNAMELTAIHDPVAVSSIPIAPVDTSPGGKRRKLNPDPEFSSPETSDMELSLMEKMSPVRLKPIESEAERDIEVNQVATVQQSRKSYSLQEFIDKAGVSFLIDIDFIEKRKNPVVFHAIQPPDANKLGVNQVLNVLYSDTPIFEMNAFICKELLGKIERSKKQFEDLNEQVSTASSPPLLLSEYFNASQEMRQSINQQLQLVKSYSKLEAKKSWFEWRIQHLNGIKNVLTENLSLANKECEKVRHMLMRVRDTKDRAEKLRDSIKKEIYLSKELPAGVYHEESKLFDKVKLEAIRQELALHSIDINNYQVLKERNQILKKEISEKASGLHELKKKILSLHQNYEKIIKEKKFTEYDITVLRNKLEMLSRITGVEFERYEGLELSFKFSHTDPPLRMLVKIPDLSRSHMVSYQVIAPMEATLFFDHICRQSISSSSSALTTSSLASFSTGARRLIPLLKQYKLLQLLYPVQISRKKDETSPSIQIRDFDLQSNSKVIYGVSLDNFLRAAFEKDSKILVTATVLDRGRLSSETLFSMFLRKISKILPWFNENRVDLSTNELERV